MELRVFRVDLQPVYIFFFLCACFGFGIRALESHGPVGAFLNYPFQGHAVVYVVLAPLLMTAITAYMIPQKLSEQGVFGWDVLGRRHLVPWGDIQEARRWRMVTICYIRLKAAGRVFYVLESLQDPVGFRKEVQDRAPEGNPLRLYLEET